MKKNDYPGLFLLPTLIVLGNSMYVPLLPVIEQAYAFTQTESTWFLSMFTLAGVVAIPFAQQLARRTNIRKAMIISCFLVMVGSLVSVWAQMNGAAMLLFAGRVVSGMGAGGATSLAYTYAGAFAKGNEKLVLFGRLELSNGVAKISSPLIGSLLLYLSWTLSPYLFFLLAVCSTFFVWRNIAPLKWGTSKVGQVSFRGHVFVAVSEYTLSLVHLFILYGLFFYASYLFSLFGFSPAVQGLLLALPFLAMVLCSANIRFVANVGQTAIRGVLLSLLLCCTLLLLFFSEQVIVLCVVLSICGGCTGVALPLASNALGERTAGAVRERLIACLSMARFLSIAAAPLFYQMWIGNGMVALGSILAVLTASFIIGICRYREKKQHITQI
ncbi:putative MFS-type transporter YitG [Shouchella clausii]|nr:putative MFS-type transporter YitG [Shouchella clausii]